MKYCMTRTVNLYILYVSYNVKKNYDKMSSSMIKNATIFIAVKYTSVIFKRNEN